MDVPELEGCMSQGKTKKEALINTKKAIKAYMEAVEKKEAPKPSFNEVLEVPFSFAVA